MGYAVVAVSDGLDADGVDVEVGAETFVGEQLVEGELV
jgi:hypothetical protein